MRKEELLYSLRQQKFSENIVKAFENVNREKFIPQTSKPMAYEDTALPIGKGQTISQPYTIAFMLSLLKLEPESKEKQKILEVGSGSGYVLALLNEILDNIKLYGVERIEELAERSKSILPDNISVIHGDGSKGLPDKQPFDRIIVSAAADEIPSKLVRQLKLGGVLVAPVGNSILQIQRFTNENKIQEFSGFRFVPLIEES